MRHAGSLLLSLFLAPLIWIGTGYGLTEVNRSRAQFAGGFEIEIVLGLLALLAAGGLYALLTMARLSPIGPALIGLVFVALAAWAAFDPASYFDTMPTDLRDGDLALTFPALGYSAMLGVPLLATLLSPRRWRRYAHSAAATPAAPAPYPMPAAGMPPGAMPPGGAYGPPQGGQPSFAAAPGYLAPPPPQGAPYPGAPGAPQPARLGDPAPTAAFPAGPQAPTSAPPVPSSAPPFPSSAPPSSAPPAEAPTTRIPTQPPPPPAEQETTTRLSQPPPDAPTTRIPTSPTTAVPAVTPPAPPAEAPTTRIPTSPTTAVPAATPAGDQTTTRISAHDTEATQLLKGPPPKDAYPRPAWSAPTPPPITPPGARKPEDDLDDPEATQPSR